MGGYSGRKAKMMRKRRTPNFRKIIKLLTPKKSKKRRNKGKRCGPGLKGSARLPKAAVRARSRMVDPRIAQMNQDPDTRIERALGGIVEGSNEQSSDGSSVGSFEFLSNSSRCGSSTDSELNSAGYLAKTNSGGPGEWKRGRPGEDAYRMPLAAAFDDDRSGLSSPPRCSQPRTDGLDKPFMNDPASGEWSAMGGPVAGTMPEPSPEAVVMDDLDEVLAREISPPQEVLDAQAAQAASDLFKDPLGDGPRVSMIDRVANLGEGLQQGLQNSVEPTTVAFNAGVEYGMRLASGAASGLGAGLGSLGSFMPGFSRSAPRNQPPVSEDRPGGARRRTKRLKRKQKKTRAKTRRKQR